MSGAKDNRDITTSYLSCDRGVRAFIARPVRDAQRPCAILLHERYGLVRHTLDLACRLARDGFVALAPDLFSRYPDQESLHRGSVTLPLQDGDVRADLEAAITALAQVPGTAPAPLAVIGVCQTGRYPVVLAAARPIQACVVVYGAAQPREWEINERQPEPFDELLARLPCPLLGIFGEADHLISVADVARLRQALEAHRKSYDIRIFAGAPHGWLNDTMPGRYRREAAEAAWQVLLNFLSRVLGTGMPADRVRWRFESDIAADYDFGRNVRRE